MFKKIVSVLLAVCVFGTFLTAYANEAADANFSVFTDEFDNGYSKGILFAYEYENMKEVVSATKQFADVSKAHRANKGKSGYITYKMPRIYGFSAKTITDVNDDIHFEFYTSADNKNWNKVAPDITDMGKQPWQGFEYSASDFGAETQYLKIFVPDVNGAESYNKQLLSVNLIGTGDPILSEDYVPQTLSAKLPETKDAKVFQSDFETVENAVITKDSDCSLTTATRYGKSCFEVINNKKDTSTRIEFKDILADANVYKAELVLMPVDKNAEREVFITFENGEKFSLIKLNCDGEIGRSESSVFKGFDTPRFYKLNEWINAQICFSVTDGNFIIKINGEEAIRAKSANIPLNGKIASVLIEDTAKENVTVTYYDFVRLSKRLMIDDTSAEDIKFNKPILKDVNLHPNKENIMFLANKGIVSGNGSFYFNPEENIAYDAFLKMVMMSVGIYTTQYGQYWAQPYIDTATIAGMNFEGINFTSYITRAQAADIISNIVLEERSQYYENVENRIADIKTLPQEEQKNIVDTVSKGIMSVDKYGNFNPQKNITRSEAATIITSIIDTTKRVSPVYKIAIFADKNTDAAKKLAECINKNGYYSEFLTQEDMENSARLSIANYSCLVLLNRLVDTQEARNCLNNYLCLGGDLVTCGEKLFDKFNNDIWQLPIYEGFDYEPYKLEGMKKVVTAKGQELLKSDVSIEGSFYGTSAIGFLFSDSSAYIPVLEANNKYGQNIGHAAGVLTNFAGKYKDSNWLIYGIGSEEFYEKDAFGETLVSVIDVFDSPYLSQEYNESSIKKRNREALENFEITEPKPEGSVTVDRETGTLIGLDGKPLFLFGANTYGLAEYLMGMGDDLTDNFDINKLEYVFKMAKDIGVNCFRFWEAPTSGKRVDVLKQMARKYGVYLYFMAPNSENHAKAYEKMESFAKAYGDEPMVIGYDLLNEPDGLHELLVRVPKEKNAIAKSDILEVCSDSVKAYQKSIDWLIDNTFVPSQPFFSREELSKIAAAEMIWRKELVEGNQSKMTVVDAALKTNLNEKQKYVLELINDTVKSFYETAYEVVHKYDPDALLTIGYLNAASLAPENKNMGFNNLHGYTFANGKADIQEALTAMDKLKADFPDVPVVFGEFCYSGGQFLKSGPHAGELADYDVAALGEVAHWLYSYAQGYSGAVIWCLQEWNPANYRWGNSSYSRIDGASWDPSDGLRRERQGLYYYYGGEEMYKAKPAAVAMKFFMEKFAQHHTPGDGELVLTNAQNQAETGFVFTADTAEYVANTSHNTDRLKFSCEKTPIVMVDWTDGNINLLATRETLVRIKPSAYIKDFKTENIEISGFNGNVEVKGQYVTITLLKDEVVTIKKK